MTDDTIITKSTSELIKARMNGEELEPFVRKAREQYFGESGWHADGQLYINPNVYGTSREHMDQFELYLNMHPEIRKKIEEDAKFYNKPWGHSVAYENAYKKWWDENSDAYHRAVDESIDRDKSKNSGGGGIGSRVTYKTHDDAGNSYVPGGGYRVTPDGRRI